ncbi:VanZ family protein [Bacillaceae bacterium IKA-2]|nr:VanZ family protein [Bacillaceae bacterium IKA-2]
MTLNKTFSWVAVVAWMALIFFLSHQPATQSNDLSTGITELIVKTVENFAPNIDFDIRSFNHMVRKNAHFIAYLVLGVLMINALRTSGVRGYRSIVLALGICVLYAISDEVHQLFIPGRSGEIRDVIIDSAGTTVGIGLYLLIGKILKSEKLFEL